MPLKRGLMLPVWDKRASQDNSCALPQEGVITKPTFRNQARKCQDGETPPSALLLHSKGQEAHSWAGPQRNFTVVTRPLRTHSCKQKTSLTLLRVFMGCSDSITLFQNATLNCSFPEWTKKADTRWQRETSWKMLSDKCVSIPRHGG